MQSFARLALLGLALAGVACSSSIDGSPGGEADAGPGARADAASGVAPVVSNFDDGETVDHDLPLLRGTAQGADVEVTVGADVRRWPVASTGDFKALVPLAPGDNTIELRDDGGTRALRLRYEPQDGAYFVRLIYGVGAGSDGRFHNAPGAPSSQADALERVALAGRLMQSAVADVMHRQGFGRATVRLARDASGAVEVRVFEASQTDAQLRDMSGLDIWYAFYDQLGGLPERALSKDLVILGSTSYDGATGEARAHLALGGDRLAMFGGGGLYSWPATLDEVAERLTDDLVIDTSVLFADASTVWWENTSTTIGAALHEMLHTLGGDHVPGGYGPVMNNGFRRLNRVLMAVEMQARAAVPVSSTDGEPFFEGGNAVHFALSRWTRGRARDYQAVAASAVRDGEVVRVASPVGVGLVRYFDEDRGEDIGFDDLRDLAPAEHPIQLADLRARFGSGVPIAVKVTDLEGNTASVSLLL